MPHFAPPLTGTYRATTDEGPAVLTLTQDAAGAVTGSLSQGGMRIAVSGRAAGDGTATLTGEMGGATVRLEVRRDGPALRVRLIAPDGDAEELTFAGEPSPRTAAKPTAKAAPKPIPKRAPPPGRAVDERTYRHPAGTSFRYPSAWKVQETPTALVLTPPDFRQGRELYVASALAAGTVTRTDDPLVTQAVDAVAAQQGLSRTRSETISLSTGAGLILHYEGTLLGQPARGRAYVTIQKGYCLYFAALAEPSLLEKREGAVRRMFGSLAMAEGKRDPLLVGSWVGELVDNGRLVRGADGKVSSNVSSNSQSRYVLSTDGSVVRTTWSQTMVSVSTRVGDSESGGIADSGERYTTTGGTWSAEGGRFSVLWDDGQVVAGTYQRTAGGVVLRFGATSLTLRRG